LEEKRYDLLVVGGGIVGACIAWDATMRGLSVALVDRGDFGSATSQNSLRIIHGGLRYLQRLELRTMRSLIRERSFWLRAAPHLVSPLPVVVPDYSRPSDNRYLLRAALALNDALSSDRNRELPEDRQLPPGRLLSPDECTELAPRLPRRGLRGGVLFHDAQMYSSERLVLEVVRAAWDAGAVVANYVEVIRSRRSGADLVVETLDGLDGSRGSVQARFVVHATGAAPPPPLPDSAKPRRPPYAAALNLMVEHGAGSAAYALSTEPSASNGAGRRLFFVPWRGRGLIGTAHFDVRSGSDDDRESLVGRFLEEVNTVLPDGGLTRDDVILVHAGYLPAVEGVPADGVRLQRTGTILEHDAPALTVVSVKYSSARALAERAVNRVVKRLGFAAAPCRTSELRLPGAPSEPVTAAVESARRRWGGTLSDDTIEHLVRAYGRDHEGVARLAARETGMDHRLDARAPVVRAQFRYGAEAEMGVTADDLIYRRTEVGSTGAVTPSIAAIAASSITANVLTRADSLSAVESDT
jgi:glycerol-3-phosphate dehydrogenase